MKSLFGISSTFIQQALVKETITVGREVDQIKIDVVWTAQKPIIYIFLNTAKEVTPTQAKLVEKFISQKMGQPVEIVFIVNLVKIVKAIDTSSPNLRTLPKPPQN